MTVTGERYRRRPRAVARRRPGGGPAARASTRRSGPAAGTELPALRLDLGNPHTVVILPPDFDLAELDLTEPPAVSPHPEHGTNVEFVRAIGPGHIAMRVHERGVGETRSCGTGAAAAALATRWWEGEADDNTDWTVDVPGGRRRGPRAPGRSRRAGRPRGPRRRRHGHARPTDPQDPEALRDGDPVAGQFPATRAPSAAGSRRRGSSAPRGRPRPPRSAAAARWRAGRGAPPCPPGSAGSTR